MSNEYQLINQFRKNMMALGVDLSGFTDQEVLDGAAASQKVAYSSGISPAESLRVATELVKAMEPVRESIEKFCEFWTGEEV